MKKIDFASGKLALSNSIIMLPVFSLEINRRYLRNVPGVWKTRLILYIEYSSCITCTVIKYSRHTHIKRAGCSCYNSKLKLMVKCPFSISRGMWTTKLLPLLPDPLGSREIVPVRLLSMDQIKLFKNYRYSRGISSPTSFSIVTTPRCRWGRWSFPWIAPLSLDP